jgi:endoglucanase
LVKSPNRGIPYIWCSNNLVVAFTMQCFWYRQLTGDRTFNELEQANIDWLFGCNPWGTSMVYGLPSWGDTPVDPHSAFTHLKKFPIDGGLIDGPVYGSIYNNLIGIKLYEPDEYAAFQSDLAVYHDDYGDYSTNEPTMDGTASLVYLLAAKENESASAAVNKKFTYSHGGIIRGDSTRKNLALVFTGHEYADGGYFIQQALADQHTTANFFFTSQFLSDPKNEKLISQLAKEKHFIGNHSEGHLLYCDWNKRDSLLVTKDEFISDLSGPYELLSHISMRNQNPAGMTNSANFFLPPYEWYNDTIAAWCQEINKTLINFTPGTGSNADYTWPGLKNYKDSKMIYQSIIAFEKRMPAGLNGFLLLMHVGTDPKRTDKFYKLLPGLVKYLKAKGYHFQRVDQLLDLE